MVCGVLLGRAVSHYYAISERGAAAHRGCGLLPSESNVIMD